MLIDWFTVIAQIINFLILLALLKHFLYGPITAAMDAREQRIVSRLREANQQQARAEEEAAVYHRKQQELEQQRASLLHEAEEAARQRHQELVAEARTDADRLRSRWRAALQQSKATFLRDLQQRSGEQVVAIARRVLADLADADMEQQIVTVFLRRVRNLDEKTRQTLQQALEDSQQAAHLRSAFALTPDQRQQIEATLREYLGKDVTLSFATTPELLAGVALRVGGHAVAWNVQSYLETLEETVSRSFAAEAQAGDTAPADQPGANAAPAAHTLVEEQ